jgi:WD40 repeat protein/serine/threonine protein kinase
MNQRPDSGRVREVFLAACGKPTDERASYLDDQCGEDLALRAEIESLLDNDASPSDEDAGSSSSSSGDAPSQRGGRLRTGTRIGQFRLVRELGRGGVGVVWEAEHLQLKRHVALKLLSPSFAPSDSSIIRFQREAEAGASLRHPGIVQIHSAGVANDIHYLEQELVPGGRTLADDIGDCVLQRELPSDYYRSVAERFAAIADAMNTAHDAGITHRDLKPSNILITEQGQPKVADFGLARLNTDLVLTRTGDLAGTPYYMSPEQAMSKRIGIDHRTDIFSLGTTLYEALTLRRPFEGDTSQQILEQIVMVEPIDPRNLRSKVPRDLAVICQKMMEKRREHRYQTMSEVGTDLGRWLSNEPILARPAGPLLRAGKWVRRHPVLSAYSLVALAFVAIIILSVFLYGESIEKQREQEEHRWQSYLANIWAAALHFENGVEVEAQRRLDACPEEYRAWEWNHLNLKRDQSHLFSLGHEAGVSEAVISAGAKFIATVDDDKHSIRIWSVDAAEEIAVFSGEGKRLSAVAVDDSGRVLITDSQDGTAMGVWDSLENSELAVLRSEGARFLTAAWSPDGSQIVTGTRDGTLRVWDPASDVPIFDLRQHDDAIGMLSFAEGGKRILSGSRDGEVRVWEAESGLELGVLYRGDLAPLAASPDGKRLILMPGRPSPTETKVDLTLWNTDLSSVQAVLLPQDLRGARPSFAFGPRGKIVRGIGDSIYIRDGNTGEELVRLRGHESLVRLVALSSDGQRIISVARDGMARIWDANTGPGSVSIDAHPEKAAAVAVSPDGRYFATGGAGQTFSGGFYYSDASVRIWDAASGDIVHKLHGHSGYVYALAFSPDGTLLASGSGDRSVRVWDVETGTSVVRLEGHVGAIAALAFSPDGNQLYSAGRPRNVGSPVDATVRSWNAHTGAALGVIQHESAVDAIAIDPTGRWLASGTRDSSIRIWSRETGEELFVLRGHEGWVTCLAFGPEGRRLVSGSTDRTLRVWDLDSAESIVLRGHTAPVSCVTVSPDGRRIASGSQSLRLWSLRTGDELAVLGGSGDFHSIAFDPSGQRMVTTSQGTLRVWESEPGMARVMWQGASLRRQAEAVVDPLFDELLMKAEVVARLEADTSLDENLRRCAKLLAKSRRDVWPGELNESAWPLVDPDRTQDTDVILGLKLAREAVKRSSESSSLIDTLSWALYANDLFDDALAESERALELAAEDRKEDYQGYLDRMSAMVEKARAEDALNEEQGALDR